MQKGSGHRGHQAEERYSDDDHQGSAFHGFLNMLIDELRGSQQVILRRIPDDVAYPYSVRSESNVRIQIISQKNVQENERSSLSSSERVYLWEDTQKKVTPVVLDRDQGGM